MSMFGKLLAVFNVLAVLAAVALMGMEYAKRRTWQYAVFRQELMEDGLPLDGQEFDGQGRPLVDNIGEQTLKELFSGNAPVATQTAEVERVRGQLDSRIQGAGDKRKQIVLYARVLMPMALTDAERERALAYQTHLRDDNSYKSLQQLFVAANEAGVKATKAKDKKVQTYDEGFHDYLASRYANPTGPLAEAFLAVMKTAPGTPVDKALDQSLDNQLTELRGQFEQVFKDALDRRSSMDAAKVGGPVAQRKRIIAHLLFNMVDVLPDETAGAAAPKLDLMENQAYKRFITVVGVRAAAIAVNDEARVLDEIAVEADLRRMRERGLFASEHHKAVEMVRDKAADVEVDRALYARKDKERKDHEDDLARRKADVVFYEGQLKEYRADTAARLKELRTMSGALFQERIKLRDDTLDNQKLEKEIRVLEVGR